MNKYHWCTNIWIGGAVSILALAGAALAENPRTHVIHDMAALYNITEEEAAGRLASEIVAASKYQLVREMDLKGYAGGWYDADSARLVVATNRSSDRRLLSSMNIDSVMVLHDLATLQELADRLAYEFQAVDYHESFRSAFVDVKANQAVLEIAPEARQVAESQVGHNLHDGRGTIRTLTHEFRTSSWTYRGAEGTRNLTWKQQHGGDWPCSIGASTEDGFVWAGHCGYFGHQIGDAAETVIGDVTESSWVYINKRFDIGKVQTNFAWTPTSTVQGYNHGVFSVSSILSGVKEFPIGSTVCRYGGTSQMASCGTINAKNITTTISGKLLEGLTRTTGMCSDDGDSGGPHIAGGSHMQGVNVGKTIEPTTCPTPLQYVFFQPMPQVLNYTNSIILTSHGASSPSVYDLRCPDPANSGGGNFSCKTSFNSQGPTTVTWTYGGNQFSGQVMFGSCTQATNVSVNLTLSNSYGNSGQNIQFPCPMGPTQ